jgi:aryl sulfotransferase
MKSEYSVSSREIVDFLSDSRVWRTFLDKGGFVPGDIIIADPFKAGTTWTQRIVDQILSNGEESGGKLSDKSPWLDSSWGDHQKMIDKLNKQKVGRVRRVIKSHLPADVVPIDPDAYYIFVGRNGKDLVLSLHNYLYNFTDETIEQINNLYSKHTNQERRLTIPESNSEFFDVWLNTDGYEVCDVFDVTKTWWDLRHLPNVLMVHYTQLKNDLPGQIHRLASFLNVDSNELNMPQILEHCDFGYMKKKADSLVPFNGEHMRSAEAFFHKGPKRDYRSELSEEQIQKFDAVAKERLGEGCYHWMETGEE